VDILHKIFHVFLAMLFLGLSFGLIVVFAQLKSITKKTLKYQKCLEHYWFYVDATTLQDAMFDNEGDILPGKEAAFDALDGTCEVEWDSFTQMANEIRQEMEG
jgi:hypothetical protein